MGIINIWLMFKVMRMKEVTIALNLFRAEKQELN